MELSSCWPQTRQVLSVLSLSIHTGACMAGSPPAPPAWQRPRWPSCLYIHPPVDAGAACNAAADAAARVAAGEGVARCVGLLRGVSYVDARVSVMVCVWL